MIIFTVMLKSVHSKVLVCEIFHINKSDYIAIIIKL
jgi:hypothetical protein